MPTSTACSPTVDRPVRRSRSSRRRRCRCTTGKGVMDRARERVPRRCGPRPATTCASRRRTGRPRCGRSPRRADAIVVIGSANSSNTIALAKVAHGAGCERRPADRRSRRARRRRARRRARRRRHRRRERARGPRAGGDRAARTDRRRRAGARHRRGRVLPAAARAARARPRARRAGHPDAGCRSTVGSTRGGPFSDDRTADASLVLEALAGPAPNPT